METTSTPLHALTTLNDPTWVEAARVLARNCINERPEIDGQLAWAFQRVICRKPNEMDSQRLMDAYQKQLLLKVGATSRDESLNLVEHAALTAVCIGILNLDEALTRE